MPPPLPTTTVPACPMCGSFRRVPFARKDGAAYVRCRRCRTTYADPRPSDAALLRRLDQFAVDPAPAGPDGIADACATEGWKVELVREHAPPGGRVLDVGTGSGAFVVAARAAGYDAEGHDLGPAVAAGASSRFGVTVHTGALAELEPAAAYDVVTMWDALEHAADPPALLGACARLLAPGGRLVVLSPHAAGVSARVLGPRWWVFGPADHLVLFSPAALRDACARRGLRVEVLVTRGVAPPQPPEARARGGVAARLHRSGVRGRAHAAVERAGLGDWILAVARAPRPSGGRPEGDVRFRAERGSVRPLRSPGV